MKSKKHHNLVIFIVCLAFTASVDAFVGTIAVGLGQMNEDVGEVETAFAADAKLETEEMNVTTKIFYQPGMVRDEISVGGQDMVTIRRFDLDKVWMLMGQNMYMEIDPEENNPQNQQYELIEREVIGRETVNGMETTKYKSVYQTNEGKFGGFTWFTDDNIAVKAFMVQEGEGENQRVKFEITDLRRGEQAQSMFEIPAGYQKFDMGNFGNMSNPAAMGGAGAAGAYGAPPTTTSADDSSTASTSSASSTPSDEPGVTGDVADAAVEGAEEAAVEETKRGVKDTVSRGIRGLFGK